MIKKWILIVMVFSLQLMARQLSFQLYVYDTVTNQPYSTEDVVSIETAFVDTSGNSYFLQTQNQKIVDGIIHMRIQVDMDDFSNYIAFDQRDLQLTIVLPNDSLVLPMTSVPLSIVSKLSDRTHQLKDTSVMNIDYASDVIQIGGGRSTDNALDIQGVLTADKIQGKGDFIYNAKGAGFNDAHSLEKNLSRTCPPNMDRSDCLYGDDVMFVNSSAYVGIHTNKPLMPLDVFGRVLFSRGEMGTGSLDFPLEKHQTLMAWDVDSASFKVGYVSRDVSVQLDTFSRSAVSIGKDSATIGLNSGVFGGESNSIYGDFSAIVGGQNNSVTGDYSVLIGTNSDSVHKGYVTNIGGQGNIVSSNYTVLLASRQNQLEGSQHTLFGENNLVRGESVFVYGSNHEINGSHVYVFGDASKVDHDRSWVINVTDDQLAMTTRPNQVIWMADHGVSINSDDYSEALVVGGDIIGETFYGDGSQLTNISKVDYYWFMHGNNMTVEDYALGIGGDVNINNRINLSSGLRLVSDGSSIPGTLSYESGDLVGYGEIATRSLLIQDTNTVYDVSSEFNLSDDELSLSVEQANRNDFLVFNDSYWEPSTKTLWNDVASLVSYSRPISFWKSQAYLGALTLAHPVKNRLVFSNESMSNGLSIELAGQDSINQPIRFGFNIKDANQWTAFDSGEPSYMVQFDSMQGGFLVQNKEHRLMEIQHDGGLNFFDSNYIMDVNIPTTSRFNKLVIDRQDGESQFAHVNYQDHPFISLNAEGRLNLQSGDVSTINFRILPSASSDFSMMDQVRLQVTNASEFLLSHKDSYSLGRPMVIVPDGDMLVDEGHEIGVFNEERQLQTGLRFNYNTMVFIPEPLRNHNVWIHDVGLGIRSTPDRVVVIRDSEAFDSSDEDASVYIQKSTLDGSTHFKLSRHMIPEWSFHSFDDQGVGHFDIYNKADHRTLQMNSTQININMPIQPNKELNIDGDMSILGQTLYLMGQDSPDDPGRSMPFVQIDGDEFVVRPVVDASGIGFYSEDDRKMIMNHGAVSIGDVPVPQNPTQSLEVHPGSFITNRLHRFDERIEFKTIQTDPVGPDHLSYIHSSANIVQHLSFDYDTGFDISTPEDYVVDISFQEHFSTYNTIRLDDDMDADTQFITPNGIDSMIYKASFISASANNVISVNSDRTEDVNEDAMDSLTFFNDLMNGGVIDGNLAISATLNVVSSGQHFDEQDYIAHGGEKGYLIGDISMMDDIPFPFRHVTTENGVVVHHEYVITENVGIGTSLPAFPLEVDGVTSVNVVISPSINVTGEFVSNKNYLNVLSEQNIYVTLNASAQHTGSLLYLNDMEIKDEFFGLNQLDEDYMMSLYTTDVGTHSDMFIQGNTRSMVSFHEVFNLVLDGDDQFHIKGLDPVQRLLFTFDESSMVVADSKLGIDMLTAPKNSLDVAGNMVIGRSLAGRVQAPPNSLMIEGQLGIGTVLPDAMTDVQGSMVQGFSSSYLGDITGLENDLVIQRRLIVEDFTSDDTESSVLVSGRIVGTGGLYFNKNSNPLNNELSFYTRDDDRLIIGYGDAITNRSLHINVVDYLTFNPKDDGQANELTIDSSAKVGFGTKTPESLFHVQKDGLAFKVEALLNAAVKFESGDHGLMGFSKDIPDQFILTDGDAFGTEVAGADFSMDADGALDIGYNIKDESAALPSHDVLMDVNGHINASAVLENGAVMTHMPEGSIVMWSGWTSDLPDGWVLCDGLTDGVPNLQNYFVLGKSDSNSYEDTVGAGNHEFVIEVSDDYQHTHGSSHGHGSFSTTNHNHGRITPGATNAKATNIAGANAGAPTMRRNFNGVEIEKEDKWENVDWENCTGCGHCALHHGKWCPMETYWVDFPKKSAYSTPTTANGHHGHPVNVSHSHNVDINNENGHNHTLGSQSHVHENIKHTHTANLEPVYYTLAFIYLKGDPVVSDTGAQP